MAADLERVGVSIEAELLTRFDARLEQKGYASRSEALRDLIRHWLNDSTTEADAAQPAMGTLTIFYDHTRRELADRLTHFGHDHHHLILTTLHFHLDHQRCLEVMALKGPVGELRHFADGVIAMKGIEHGRLVVTVEGTGEPHAHPHPPGHRHP